MVAADPDTIFDSLRRFAGALTGGYGIGDVLHNLTEEMTRVLDLTGAGVTLVHDGRQRFVTAAIEAIADLERVQENHQLGPCIDAVAAASPVTVSETAREDTSRRWPDYIRAAEESGIRAVAGIPMRADEVAIGAVNLYDSEPRTWTREELRTAGIFADIATGYVVHASAARQHQRTAEQLQQALATRVMVEQAKGVLATRHAISIDEAFGRLRKYARDHQAGIHDVALGVVEGKILA